MWECEGYVDEFLCAGKAGNGEGVPFGRGVSLGTKVDSFLLFFLRFQFESVLFYHFSPLSLSFFSRILIPSSLAF